MTVVFVTLVVAFLLLPVVGVAWLLKFLFDAIRAARGYGVPGSIGQAGAGDITGVI